MTKLNNSAELKTAEDVAVRYLSRREYSRRELYQRLISKGFQSDIANQVLSNIQEKGYQSDQRFAECYIRSKINSGDGPFKIKIALRAKGICDSLILAVFDSLQVNWVDQAQALKHKRFGELQTDDMDEVAKQMRYLKNRGFYQDHINAVIHHTSNF